MKTEDINGFWIYAATPVTKEGVYPYRGRSLDTDGSMGLDPNKKYMVYRPAAEITKPEVLSSFEGVFLTDGHEMLGQGARDPGTKPIAGTVFNVRVDPKDPGTVLADIKVMSEDMKRKIEDNIHGISCGYYCEYRPQKGEFKGQHYDFVQTDLIGNHVAVVKKGRMGEKCALDSADDIGGRVSVAMDSADYTDLLVASINKFAKSGGKALQVRRGKKSIACDAALDIETKEVKFMNPEEMLKQALEQLGIKSKEQIDTVIGKINEVASAAPASAATGKDGNTQEPASTSAPTATPTTTPTQTPTTTSTPTQTPKGEEGNDGVETPTNTPTPITQEEFQSAVDAAVEARYQREDEGRQFGEDIAPKTGSNIWKRGMDADDVAEEACKQLGYGDMPKDARKPFLKALAEEAKKSAATAPKAEAPKGKGMDGAEEINTPKAPSTFMAKYYAKAK